MPTSDIANITPIMTEVVRRMPNSVLDLGVGVGKYGMLCREKLDVEQGRIEYAQWKTNIVGVEGFEKYRNPVWSMYSRVKIEDFTQTLYEGFDMVLMIDSLEHVDKGAGEALLRRLLRSNKHVIVSCPDGDYPQGAWGGNEYERHRAVWRAEDLLAFGGTLLHRSICSVVSIPGGRR